MKYYLFCIAFTLIISCKSKINNASQLNNDSAAIQSTSPVIPVSDSAALLLSKEILSVIKNKEYNKLTAYIQDSIRFSPYGYIDTRYDKKFSIAQLLNYLSINKNEKFTWGEYDGSGKPILLTANEYFKKFVYDVDFVNAEKVSLNKSLSKGNSLNNIDSVYQNYVYTEFYFPGFEKKYGGMDWKSLKLVFKKTSDKLYLVAIIHDEWTI